ncbi:MAG: type III pantothenate kinase [Flavobacteriales bacterium]|jgi:type III pantothenate kinase|tara:strand:- start:3051 stop:3755 length:705 start_codon:yes stop_codon:yes gene_type:complete
MKLIIDIGNTLVKYAIFSSDEIVIIYKKNDVEISFMQELIQKHNVNDVIISSVRDKVDGDFGIKTLYLNHLTPLPITINYETPETLGNDRIANVVAASVLYPNKNILIIDAGTCITIDFIDQNKEYQGGRISPGIEMRYKSLHKYTSNLPKLTISNTAQQIGKDTNSSIVSGVEKGVVAEIETIIDDFKNENEDLFVIVTGGDTFFFENTLKNSIFADQNLVLKGLNEILKYNE